MSEKVELAAAGVGVAADVFGALRRFLPLATWPGEAGQRAGAVEDALSALAETIERADGDSAALRDVVAEARRHLPGALSDFGAALGEGLAAMLLSPPESRGERRSP